MGAALDRLPATILLTFPPVILGGIVGVLVGAIAVTASELTLRSVLQHDVLVAVVSTADFWIATMLVLVFSVHLPIFPTGGYDPKPQVLVLPWWSSHWGRSLSSSNWPVRRWWPSTGSRTSWRPSPGG